MFYLIVLVIVLSVCAALYSLYKKKVSYLIKKNNQIKVEKNNYRSLEKKDLEDNKEETIKKVKKDIKKVSWRKKKKVEENKTMIQFFEWYYPNDGSLWNKLKEEAAHLRKIGITSIWLPPAYKAHNGINDAGYAAYDLFDLGEFYQKGTIRTKYGTKQEYIDAISEAHKNNLKVYGDVVFNHKAGADKTEVVTARQVDYNDRNVFISDRKNIKAHTIFDFPGRKGKYSSYIWTHKDFDGVDYDENTKTNGIFKFEGKEWEQDVDKENGNYDFLMFADLDMDSESVVDELKRWGEWYLNETNVDGFRLDAIKHIKFDFFKDWLEFMRSKTSKSLFAVGEYWTWDVNCLKYYLKQCDYSMSLFDSPLHFNFLSASSSYGYYDMRNLLDNTLVKECPYYAVTFVDNHDTEIGQSLESWVQPWFKPLAYTFILTRQDGYPCIFYGDYYGIPTKNYFGIKDKLDIILKVRKNNAYGTQNDYIDHHSIIGWTREGDEYHENSGLAALITNGLGGEKRMCVGEKHSGETWYDISGEINEKVIIDKNGEGVFKVKDGSYSLWINEGKND